MSPRLLLQGGTVLTLGAKTPNYPSADLLIEDGVIREIGPSIRIRNVETIDAEDTIVMPGFVDTHRHVWQSLFRNFGDGTVDASHLQPDDVYAATLVGLLGAAEAGITTVVDWADVALDDEATDAALQAHADAGLRSVFVHPSSGQGPPERATRPPGSNLTFAFGADLSGLGLEQIRREWSRARELGLRIHVHAGIAPAASGSVAELAQSGLLGADVTLVHCSHLGDADIDAIAASGASVSLAPSTEMARGLGSPPLQKLLDRGIDPGLAVDDERIAPGDMFAQMRITNSIQHAAYFDLKLAGKAGLPNLLTTRDVIRYGTIAGAHAVGLGNLTGSLEVGKRADLIVLRTDLPNIHPINDPIGAVVWGMDTANIDWVFVEGRPVVRHRQLEGDVTNARRLAVEAQERVMAAAGLAAGAPVGENR